MQFNRRSFLCAGSASVFSAISRYPANAQSEEISVPCVEWLAVRIVAVANPQRIENSAGSTGQLQSAGSIAFQSLATPSAGSQQDATIYVQSACGTKMRSFLIDPCSDPRVLLEHVDRLRIDLSSLDALVLTGDSQSKRKALNEFLIASNGYLKKNIEVVTKAYGQRMKTSSFELGSTERACADDACQSRIVGEQLLIVGSRQNAIRPFRSDDISLIGYQSGPQRLADSTQISANFILIEKGLVIVTSSNEGVVDCVRAAQAASGCCDVHALIGMNIGAGKEPAKAQSILSELLEVNPAHLIVSPKVADIVRNTLGAKTSTKIISGLAGTRVVLR